MKLQGFLSALSLAAIAGAAVPICPEECERDCCADGQTKKAHVIELMSDDDLPRLQELQNTKQLHQHLQNIVQSDDDLAVAVNIVNDDVTATVNGKKVNPDRIQHKDGKIVIQIEGHDDIVVPLRTGGWATFENAAPGFAWRSGGDNKFFFAPEGDEEFTIFQPSGGSNRAIIGINISDADEDTLRQLGIDGAIRIDGVIDGTPAAKAGIKTGDLLVKINGKRAGNIERLRDLLADKDPGDKVDVQILRKGDKRTFAIKLAPATSFGEFTFNDEVIELSPEFDLDVEDMLKDLKTRHGNLELHAELTDELHNKLKNLHIELAPMHEKLQGQLRGRVFGELREMQPQGGVIVAPRLRLHSGENGVFQLHDGKQGGVLQLHREHADGHDIDARLNRLAERIERLEQRLDRLANALEKQ